MNLHHLEYFLAIVEENNISRAAERLHMSQQSLSEHLKKIESELGVSLIERGRTMNLTLEGRVFADAARNIVSTYHDMLAELEMISQNGKMTIRLAVPATVVPPFIPELLAAFAVEHPEYRVKLIRLSPIEAAKMAREFDLYFSTLPLASELEHTIIREGGSYAVALNMDLANRVYGNRWPEVEKELIENRQISALQDMPFILLRNKYNNVILDQEMIFQQAGFVPRIGFESENGDLNAQMCGLGVGAYIAMEDYCRYRFAEKRGLAKNMQIYPLDTDIFPVVIALSCRKGKRLTKADNCFINFTKQFLQSELN